MCGQVFVSIMDAQTSPNTAKDQQDLARCELFWSETLGVITTKFPEVKQWIESNPEEITQLETKFKYEL